MDHPLKYRQYIRTGFIDIKSTRNGIKHLSSDPILQLYQNENDRILDNIIRARGSVKDFNVIGFGFTTRNDSLYEKRWIEGTFGLFKSAILTVMVATISIVVGNRFVRFDYVETIKNVVK